jgi:hypothetical protein
MRVDKYQRLILRFLKEAKQTLALLALKRRKQQGELINQAEEQLFQINSLISNVEMASMQAELVKALEAGTKALKTIQAEISVDYVAQLMDENSELQSEVTEIGKMLASVQSDDPDVFEEFKKLEAIVALDRISEVPNVPATELSEMIQNAAPEMETITKGREVLAAEPGKSVNAQELLLAE